MEKPSEFADSATLLSTIKVQAKTHVEAEAKIRAMIDGASVTVGHGRRRIANSNSGVNQRRSRNFRN